MSPGRRSPHTSFTPTTDWRENNAAEGGQERRELSYPDTVVVPYCSESIQVKRGRPISDSIDVGRISGLKSAAQSPPARNDMWECLVDIGRGVYDITCTGGANCYHGKLQLYLNGVKCGRVLDWYCEATCHPISFYVCGVRVEESGAHTLRGEVVGKAPKSNDCACALRALKPRRTRTRFVPSPVLCFLLRCFILPSVDV